MLLSVIICSHNPRADYLGRVLSALKNQTLSMDQWELLLVDNASSFPLEDDFNLTWHPNARHLREAKTGLTHARLRGIAASRGELLVFVDDDNILCPNYLTTCLTIAADYPRIGAWGGSCLPEYETEPASELAPWLTGLVIETITAPCWANLRRNSEACPSGAGMAVRRVQATHYRSLVINDPSRLALDRSGSLLSGGGDTDMALCGVDLGFGTGRFPDLVLTHLIPAERVRLKYLAGINEGFGYSNAILGAIYGTDKYPGRMPVNKLRLFALNILMILTGKSREERCIRIALEKGRFKAMKDIRLCNIIS